MYNTKVSRPITPVYELMKEPNFTDENLGSAVNYVFEAVTFRPPSPKESDEYLKIVKDSIDKVGKENGVFMGLSAIFLDRDALFRPELGQGSKPDEYGRVILRDWELGLALNHALSYVRPDQELRKAVMEGRMRTREDVERELTRMLEDEGPAQASAYYASSATSSITTSGAIFARTTRPWPGRVSVPEELPITGPCSTRPPVRTV